MYVCWLYGKRSNGKRWNSGGLNGEKLAHVEWEMMRLRNRLLTEQGGPTSKEKKEDVGNAESTASAASPTSSPLNAAVGRDKDGVDDRSMAPWYYLSSCRLDSCSCRRYNM